MEEKIVLELTTEQAYAVMAATELLARLHIGQFKEITWQFIDRMITDGHYDADRRDKADELLEQACKTIFGTNEYGWPNIGEKDNVHERCWAVYATIRYVMAWHRNPKGGTTVNYHKPLGYGEPMPKCRVEEVNEGSKD